MRPIDPRLLRYARTTRVFLAATVALGLAGAGLVIVQAMLIADIVNRTVGAFHRHDSLRHLTQDIALLAAVAAGRALVNWLTELAAHRTSAAVKSELRGRLLRHVTGLGPSWMDSQRTGELTTLALRGIDALDDYFARYLPQLGLAVVVPAVVLAAIATADWESALIIVVTLPLIPVFMALIGWHTENRMKRQWRLLTRLSGHFLDVVAGLPTLKVFGRAKAQATSIRKITDDYRRATLKALRVAFLSSFALELLSTLSVALVAVGIGFRLVDGSLGLYTGLLVLVLAPEAYLPLRKVGAEYHAAAEGLAAADEIFAILETPALHPSPPGADALQAATLPARTPGSIPAPDIRHASLVVDNLTVTHDDRRGPSLAATSFTVSPGETVALIGPSGAGKSTLLSTLLGFISPTAGRITIDDKDLTSLEPRTWRDQIAWVPQRPYLFAGSIADNVRLGRPDATDDELRTALADAHALDFVNSLARGTDTHLGEGGAGLSTGQRQRLALARAFLSDRPLLLLDEPTANLDGTTEAEVVDAIRRLAAGRTVILVVHRPALIALADRVVRIAALSASLQVAATTPNGAVVQETEALRAAVMPARLPPLSPLAPAAAACAASTAASTAASSTAASALSRVRGMAGPLRPRFALAVALGALALCSAIGLMATSGWLISRASQQPPILYLMVAVTATRAFGIGRAVFRYAERLVSHDAVFRTLADLRAAVYRRLECLAPAGLRDIRRGDLLSRLVADVDSLQDYFLRWLLPAATAAVVSTAAVAFTTWLLPAAGAALALGLLAAGAAVPALSAMLSRCTESTLAPVRGRLSTQVVDLLSGTAELTVAGALPARLRATDEVDRALTRIASRSAATAALGSALTALFTGVTVAAGAY
ncbi:MAG: thiol reductant ABC exporter subunit CydD, partial [Streptomycetaceae bacterium]|nr:thiol reductant ABC exporter subunit CydD [Streptomycetaceae bacterium]